jgi:hypothetical protein
VEIEVVLHKIKVSRPDVCMFMTGPRILPRTEMQIESDREVDAAQDTYIKALEKAYGRAGEKYLNVSFQFEDWFDEKYRLILASGIDNFRTWYMQLTAEAYAMYLQGEKDKLEEATRVVKEIRKSVEDAEIKTS